MSTDTLTIDGTAVGMDAPGTLLDLALRNGIGIPHPCRPGNRATGTGSCRLCLVEVEGEPAPVPACRYRARPGLVVTTAPATIRLARRVLSELMLAETGGACAGTADTPLRACITETGVSHPGRFPDLRPREEVEAGHPFIRFDPNACICCGACVHACREEQGHDIISLSGHGPGTRIFFDLEKFPGQSGCVSCGACLQACPSGALSSWREQGSPPADRATATVCPFCAVGCRMTVHSRRDGMILRTDSDDGPPGRGRLCIHGRFHFGHYSRPDRLLEPMIRRPGIPRGAPGKLEDLFVPVSWDEALDLAARRLTDIRDTHGGEAIAGLGGAKSSNEDAWLFARMIRQGLGSPHTGFQGAACTGAPAAILDGMFSGRGWLAPLPAGGERDLFLVIGTCPERSAPVMAGLIREQARDGTPLVLVSSGHQALSAHARCCLTPRPGTDIHLLGHLAARLAAVAPPALTAGHRDFLDTLAPFSGTGDTADITGIPARDIEQAYQLLRKAGNPFILCGRGITQGPAASQTTGLLGALGWLGGHAGNPRGFLHITGGHGNSWGAAAMGVTPGTGDNDPAGILAGTSGRQPRGLYLLGEDPVQSVPGGRALPVLERLSLLIVQDVLPCRTAHWADIILPGATLFEKDGTVINSSGDIQMLSAVRTPPGQARDDLWILNRLSLRLGMAQDYDSPRTVFAGICHDVAGLRDEITWSGLARLRSLPLRRDPPGDRITPVPVALPATIAETPGAGYPLVLRCDNSPEAWNTLPPIQGEGSRTPVLLVATDDFRRLELADGDQVLLSTRQGSAVVRVRAGNTLSPGTLCLRDGSFRDGIRELFATVDSRDGSLPAVRHSTAAIRKIDGDTGDQAATEGSTTGSAAGTATKSSTTDSTTGTATESSTTGSAAGTATESP